MAKFSRDMKLRKAYNGIVKLFCFEISESKSTHQVFNLIREIKKKKKVKVDLKV